MTAEERAALLADLHTTTMGEERIRRNAAPDAGDVIAWCRARVAAPDAVMEKWEPAEVPEDQKDGTPEAKANGRKRICDCTPYSFPQTEPEAINRMELESVTAYLRTQNPRSWQVFCLKEWYGISVEEIAEKFDITPSRIYQLVGAVQKLGKKYRQENL